MPSESVATTGLRFTFVDVEGGAATLIVTPAGESILIDSGNPGDRDAGRIAAAAKAAGVTEITHYITTHYHSDHFGGIFPLSKIVPVALGIAPFCAKRNTPMDGAPFAGIALVEKRL